MATRTKKSTEVKSRRPVSSKVTSTEVSSFSNDFPSHDSSAKRMGNRKTLYLLATAAIVLGLLYYYKDMFVVATVNGRPISRMAVVSEVEKRYGKETVDNLVTKELILQEASKNGVTVSQEEIDAEVKKIEDDLTKQGQTLDEVLTMQGLTKADVEDNLKIKIYIEKLLSDKVSVSDDDAKKYFDENKTLFEKDAKFEDQKEQIKTQLKDQKLQEQFQTWLADLKANAKVNYFKTY